MTFPVTQADLLSTARRLREQAGRIREQVRSTINGYDQDRNDYDFCIRNAEQMEKEAE